VQVRAKAASAAGCGSANRGRPTGVAETAPPGLAASKRRAARPLGGEGLGVTDGQAGVGVEELQVRRVHG